jgi:hypothetical protein
MKLLPTSTVVAKPGILWKQLGDDAVLLDTSNNCYHSVDEVGRFIWTLIQAPKTLDAINRDVIEHFDTTLAQCSRDVVTFLTELFENGLIRID